MRGSFGSPFFLYKEKPMEISILRPCAIALGDGGSTQRLEVGKTYAFVGDVMDLRMKSLVNSGFAIEVQGNAPVPEVKKSAPKRKAPVKNPIKKGS
jgi:hypothetical protein